MKQNMFILCAVALVMALFVQCESTVDSGSTDEPPEPPRLISPVNESDNQSSQPELRWREIQGANNYHLVISKDESFESTEIDTVLSRRSYKPNSLERETTYHWRVRAQRGNSNGRWSNAWRFTTATEDQEPIIVELESPEDGVELDSGSVLFEWSPLSGVSEYHFQLTTHDEFEEVLADTILSDAVVELDLEHVEEGYFWRVTPIIDTEPTEWSSVWSFVTTDNGNGGGTPTAVSLAYPSDRASDQPISFTFEWDEIFGIYEYRFQLSTSDSFENPEFDEEVEGTTYDISDLDFDERYYWRVQALNGETSGEWSSARRFDTESDSNSEPVDPDAFVQVQNANFVVDGQPFRFVGTNAYYLPNYEKIDTRVVDRAFDAFEEAGITVIRMWAFYDGFDCGYSQHDSSENVIQTAPGEYSESALRDLDRVIAKGKERGIRFILPLVNYWDELGGICQYNTWAGASNPGRNMNFFINNDDTQQWFRDYIDMLLNRVNTETGVAYKDEPAIMAWQIINEGRNSGADPGILRDWYQEIAQYIKSIDSNHLLGTGEEGFDEGTPSEYSSGEYSNTYVLRAQEGTSYVMNTAIPEIDFASAHWYPQDWGFGWEPSNDMFRAQRAWLDDHQRIAEDHGKPFILGEYGYVGYGDSRTLQVYEELWDHAESIDLDGSLLWQLTADYAKCSEFGGNICWPDGRQDEALFQSFRDHIRAIQN